MKFLFKTLNLIQYIWQNGGGDGDDTETI